MELINSKEKRVLGAIYKLGSASISDVAKETLINRTALYHTVESLMNMGLVTKTKKEDRSYFQALSASAYDDWSRRQIAMVSNGTGELKEWLDSQEAGSPTLHSDLKYFEGIEGVKNLYDDSWRDNQDNEICAITDYDKAYDTLNDYMEKEYFPTRIKKGIRVKSLVPKNHKTAKRDITRSKELLRDMRFIDLFKDLGIEINIYGSKVSIVSFDKDKPSGIIIKNEIVASAFKEIFVYLWKSVKR